MQTTFKNFKPEISCIYVNYHSAQFLERSLESLFRYERDTAYEIIIVNNDQGEQNEIENIKKKFGAQVVSSFHNPGFGASANSGAQNAMGEILFFINPDTRWVETFFKKVQETFTETKKIGALGIQLISPEGKKENQKRKACFWFPRFFSRHKQYTWISGGAFFIKKELFTTIGGFDERFFMYFEDMDLCVRLQQVGYTILLDQYQVVHYGGKSHSSKKSQKKLYDHSLYQYTKKHWSLLHYSFFRLTHPLYRFFFPYGRS